MTASRATQNANISLNYIVLIVAILSAWLPSQAFAVDYFVWGRVFSATPLAIGETVPTNPLTREPPLPDEQIIGDNLVAQVPRNLVKVKVVAASDGNELGSFITRHDGGYLVSFTSTVTGSIAVRFVVEELATSKTLLESEDTSLAAEPTTTPNIRYLLIEEDLSEIGGGGDVTDMASAGKYTGIFTRVGKIELATEVEGSTTRLINTTTGRATIPDTVSSDLQIPKYKDSPFGGNLYLFGAFSQYLYGPTSPPDNTEIFYKIQIENIDASTTEYMDDPLVKTKYTVNFTTGTVGTERVILGPIDGGGLPGCTDAAKPVCYRLTPVSLGANIFWSFPDLLALWRTGGLNGNYRLTLEVEGLATSSDFENILDYTSLKLHLDNKAPVAKIQKVEAGGIDYDTPRVYIPSPADPGISGDLTASLLGTFPADYGGTSDQTCEILNMEGPLGQKYLFFKLTAYHENGFMRYWQFRYHRNDNGYATHIGKVFNGTAMVDFASPQVSSTESDQHGFQDKFLYLNNSYLQPGGGTDLGSCGYRFEIRATTRTTDGYHYLRYRWNEDIHYLLR
jgi:hypothetical protein